MTTETFENIQLPTFKYKTSTSIPISTLLLNTINSQFGLPHETVKTAILSLQSKRDSIINTQNTDIILSDGVIYYNYLNTLMRRLTLSQSSFSAEFTWSDTSKKQSKSMHSISFEISNVLYNLSCAFMNKANELFKTDIQTAISHLRTAAYLFEEIQKVMPIFDKTTQLLDLMSENIKTLNCYCLLAVQYLIYKRSIFEEKTSQTQEKLGVGMMQLSLILKEMIKSVKPYMDKVLYAQLNYFWRFAHADFQFMKGRLDVENDLRYGCQLSRVKYCTRELEDYYIKDLPKDQRGIVEGYIKTLKKEIAQMEKDNDEIYMDNEPDMSSFEYLEAKILARPNPLPPFDMSALRELLPLNIRTAYNEYVNKSRQFCENLTTKVPQETKEGEAQLKRMKIRELIEIITSPTGIPKALHQFANNFYQTKEYTRYIQRVKMIHDTIQQSENTMTGLKRRYDEEAIKDQKGVLQYKERWVVFLVSKDKEKLDRINEIDNYIMKSKRMLVNINSKMKLSEMMFKTLEESDEYITHVMLDDYEKESLQPYVIKLSEAMEAWEKLLAEREELYHSTMTTLQSNEKIIIDELNQSDDQPAVVAKYLKQFNELNSQIEASFTSQIVILETISQHQTEILGMLGTKALELSSSIDNLNITMTNSRILNKEINICISLQSEYGAKIKQLEVDIITYLDRHAFESEELIKRINTMTSSVRNPMSCSVNQQMNQQMMPPRSVMQPNMYSQNMTGSIKAGY